LGKCYLIYNGSTINGYTYNFYNPGFFGDGALIGTRSHMKYDVDPYFEYGNAPG